MAAVDDNVQNRQAIAGRICTKTNPGTPPLFFIGSSPSMANRIISSSYPAAGVMVSVNALRKRISAFGVTDWILDSGAFTEISRYGHYRYSVEEYAQQIFRWSRCGNLLIAVAQDWMCEPFVLERTGLPVVEHQRLSIERYDSLLKLSHLPIMPVIQGYRVDEYISHLYMYGSRLSPGQWVGVGSICRRNGSPLEVLAILKTIKLIRPDLRLHGFGLKQLALENKEVRSLLHSCDSMAWSVPRKFGAIASELELAHQYQQRIHAAVSDSVHKQIPRTAGAGNGQGRKPLWNRPTKAIRVPVDFADELLRLAKEWDKQ